MKLGEQVCLVLLRNKERKTTAKNKTKLHHTAQGPGEIAQLAECLPGNPSDLTHFKKLGMVEFL